MSQCNCRVGDVVPDVFLFVAVVVIPSWVLSFFFGWGVPFLLLAINFVFLELAIHALAKLFSGLLESNTRTRVALRLSPFRNRP